MTLPRLLPIILVLNYASATGATIESAGSGNWSEAATWKGERIPAAGDKVVIQTGPRISVQRARPQ